MNELPSIEDVVVQTTAVLINLAARALADEKPDEARQGIEAARALLPQCPEEVQKQLRDPLAHLQMEFVKASQPQKPESKLWTPPGSS
jgi:hypothetical protein